MADSVMAEHALLRSSPMHALLVLACSSYAPSCCRSECAITLYVRNVTSHEWRLDDVTWCKGLQVNMIGRYACGREADEVSVHCICDVSDATAHYPCMHDAITACSVCTIT